MEYMKREFKSNVFDDIRNKLVSAYCTVTSNVFQGGGGTFLPIQQQFLYTSKLLNFMLKT